MSAIEKGDILKSRRYRNRRLGDFLKELDLTEGRSTGVPTIQEKLADNGSPRATFETTEDRLTFLIHIPIHAGCDNKPATEKTIYMLSRDWQITKKQRLLDYMYFGVYRQTDGFHLVSFMYLDSKCL